ncbi:hypothetical protein DFJ77DRAFT_32101 [Powellomyces hirtus]|nr:hypothetical protein DFJ77DRAFT_32101 [Powellomyces hirtus]
MIRGCRLSLGLLLRRRLRVCCCCWLLPPFLPVYLVKFPTFNTICSRTFSAPKLEVCCCYCLLADRPTSTSPLSM